MEIKKITDTCLEVRIDYSSKSTSEFMFISDVHYDNPKCKRKLVHKHLDYALENNIPVFCFGDFFCLMQGKYDPRRSKGDIRPEHNSSNYLDTVFRDTAEKMSKYSKVLKMVSDGNHETAILKNCEVDPLDNFCHLMNVLHNGDVTHMGYHGFIRFKFHRNGAAIRTINLYFHHGKYGGAVTKGVTGVVRHSSAAPEADIIVTGHTHDKWMVEHPRYILKSNGKMVVRPQYHLKCGTFKEEFEKSGGWAVERIAMPKSMGGWIMNVSNLGSKDSEPDIIFSNFK